MRFFESFVPRSDSAWIFAITMAAYCWIAEDLVLAIINLFHLIPPTEFTESQRSLFLGLMSGLLVAPIFETCLLIGAIELLRWLKSPEWLQVLLSAAILAVPHAIGWGPRRPLIVMPSFAIQAASYLWWRSTSRKKAFAVVAFIHSLINLLPSVADIAKVEVS